MNHAARVGRDEAAAFIGETVADLSGLARSRKPDMLGFLLGMAQREAGGALAA